MKDEGDMDDGNSGQQADTDARKAMVLYCRCAFAQILSEERKAEVLRALWDGEVEFEAVTDLCQMSARQAPEMQHWAERAARHGLKIAACHPRAVRALFVHAGRRLPDEGVSFLNMRAEATGDLAAWMEGRA